MLIATGMPQGRLKLGHASPVIHLATRTPSGRIFDLGECLVFQDSFGEYDGIDTMAGSHPWYMVPWRWRLGVSSDGLPACSEEKMRCVRMLDFLAKGNAISAWIRSLVILRFWSMFQPSLMIRGYISKMGKSMNNEYVPIISNFNI